MSNVREFSIVRRRKNLVDMLIPRVDDTSEYRIEVADNFDATYNQIFAAPQASGFLDINVDRRVLTKATMPGNAKVRAVFDPDTYAGSELTNGDDGHFWMRMVRVDAGGTPQAATAGVLVITEDERQAQQQIVIAGTAPNQAAPGLRIDLPRRMDDFNIRNNEAAAVLLVATTFNGPEYTVEAQTTWSPYFGATPCLYVRGSGATAAFSASFTNTFPQ